MEKITANMRWLTIAAQESAHATYIERLYPNSYNKEPSSVWFDPSLEARVGIERSFCSFIGSSENKKICFWNLLTFTSSEDVGTKLAFLYVVHHQVGIFEILLHLTFRPYNAYCIYAGSNSDPNVIASITQLVECYKTLHPETNIFMSKDTKSVKWGNYSLLEADLICMEQLLSLRNQ